MKLITTLGAILLMVTTTLAQTQDTDWSIRASGHYQFFSFSGQRTNSTAFGGLLEKRVGYNATAGLNVMYITRNEDAQTQQRTVPGYQNIVHISPMYRNYFDKALKGPYAGVELGIGIPEENGVQPEIGGHFGYLILNNSIAIDINMQIGFGSYRYTEQVTDRNGFYLYDVRYVDYGFFFRPGISIGLAK
jgi:hypothetical protein